MNEHKSEEKNIQFIESFKDASSPAGSTEDRIKEIQEWITDNNDEHSPVKILGEKCYINFLYYLIIYMVDLQIGIPKSFDPDQDYRQEVKRFNYTIILTDCRSDGYNEFYADNDELNIYGIEINSLQNSLVHDFSSYMDSKIFADNNELNIDSMEINSLQNSSVQDFIDGDVNYSNYLCLRKIDLKLVNCLPYRPLQDYYQELIRHEKTVELYYTIGDIDGSDSIYFVNCAYEEIIDNNFEATGFLD